MTTWCLFYEPHIAVVFVERYASTLLSLITLNFFSCLYIYTLFTNGRQPGTNTRPNMELRRFGIKICFRVNLTK